MKNISAAEVRRAFGEMVKSIKCPECDTDFSDAALEWGDAWAEGRRDLMLELKTTERDGPYKVKCELCGHRAWIDYFAKTARNADPIGGP